VINRSPWLRIDDCKPRTPLEVANERRPEFRVFGQAQFVRCFKQQAYPAAPLILGEVSVEVLLNHVRVSAMLLGILRWATKDFGQKRSNVCGMIGTHVRKHGCEQWIASHVLVEARGQTAERINAANPLIETWNAVIGHGVTCGLTFEFTRARKRAKPAVALRVQRRVRQHLVQQTQSD
jgi:hypothetical protein